MWLSDPAAVPGRLSSLVFAFTPFDWFVLALALWSVIRGLVRGLVRELFALIALFAGLIAATWNYASLALWLARWIPQPTSASIVAFLLLALAVTFGVLLAGRLIRSAVHLAGLGPLDRLVGGAFGLVRASLVAAAIFMACIAFLPQEAWLEHSQLAPGLLRIAHGASLLAPTELQRRILTAVAHLNNTAR